MSVPGNRLLKRASPGGCRCRPPCAPGRPGSVVAPSSAPSVTSRIPPGLRTRTVPSRRTAPQLRAAAAAATLPVPQASVSPAPRSHTRKSRSSPSLVAAGGDPLDVDAAGEGGLQLGPELGDVDRRRCRGRAARGAGCPTSTVRARRSSNSWGWSGPSRAGPMSTLAVAQPGASPGVYSTVRGAAGGGHGEARRPTRGRRRRRPGPGSGCRCRSSRPRRRRRCAAPWTGRSRRDRVRPG